MEQKHLICIGCPLGCPLTVTLSGGEIQSVAGNTCPNGEKYARKELTNPTRIVTSTVRLADGRQLPVKTATDIPKGKIMDCIRAMNALCLSAPVCCGQVLQENIADTGVALVATKTVR